jgi:undecaprenyl-diphosphatase
MLTEILLAIIQAATEFLPISSSGHLALVSNLISAPNLFFFTALHLSSLLAVIVFTRKEIASLITFRKEYRKLWLYLIIATIPAGIVGFLFKSYIESSLSSFLFLGVAFIFTGLILLLTRFSNQFLRLNWKNSIFIGLLQAISVFPGVSRSGVSISAGLFSGLDREKAARFSFLLFIPLVLGAFILELENFSFSLSLLVSFIICFFLSLLFLNILLVIVKKNYFWLFSIYCFAVGLISIILNFLT